MIEGLIQIGQSALKERGLLENIIKELEPEVKGKRRHVLKINFSTSETKLEFNLDEEMNTGTSSKYCYVGPADGANSPQWYASSSNITYFLNQTINSLTDIDLGDPLNSKIKYILENYFVDLEDETLKRYRYALDLSKIGIQNFNVKERYNEYIASGKKGSKFSDVLAKELEAFLKSQYGVKLNDFGLFVICIDGVPLTDYEEYRRAVLESKKPKKKAARKSEKSICHICGNSENVSDDLTKTKLKYYTTNLAIFASGFNKSNYKKNMQLCENCLNSLLAGETYVINNFSTKLATFKVYIIPHFIYGENIDIRDLDFIKDKINYSFDTLKNLSDIDEFRNELDMSLSFNDTNAYFLLNFMFYKNVQKSTKIQRLINDVNPGIFRTLCKSIDLAKKETGPFLGKHDFNLYTIYNMTPIRESKGEATEYRNILNIYDAILTLRSLDRRNLINGFCRAAAIINRKQENDNYGEYNISRYKTIEGYINRTLIFLKMLEKLGCLKEGEAMDVSKLSVRDDLKEYIEAMGYDEERAALFLLGYLIGEVGNAQRKRLNDKKPILNKLNFNGIDKQKILRLSSDVFNKLNQEKANDKPLRVYNEAVYFEFKRLLDKNLANWSLNKNENLYYILSGYSYASVKPFLKEDEKDEQ